MDIFSRVNRGSWSAKKEKAEICNIMCFIEAWLQEHSKIPTTLWDLGWRRHKKPGRCVVALKKKVWQCLLTTDGVIMSLLLSKSLSARKWSARIIWLSVYISVVCQEFTCGVHTASSISRVSRHDKHISLFLSMGSYPVYLKLSESFFNASVLFKDFSFLSLKNIFFKRKGNM